MKRAIKRVTVPPRKETLISIQQNAKILSVVLVDGQVRMYYMCDPQEVMVGRTFSVVCTGDEFTLPATYIGTVYEDGVAFHILEVF